MFSSLHLIKVCLSVIIISIHTNRLIRSVFSHHPVYIMIKVSHLHYTLSILSSTGKLEAKHTSGPFSWPAVPGLTARVIAMKKSQLRNFGLGWEPHVMRKLDSLSFFSLNFLFFLRLSVIDDFAGIQCCGLNLDSFLLFGGWWEIGGLIM